MSQRSSSHAAHSVTSRGGDSDPSARAGAAAATGPDGRGGARSRRSGGDVERDVERDVTWAGRSWSPREPYLSLSLSSLSSLSLFSLSVLSLSLLLKSLFSHTNLTPIYPRSFLSPSVPLHTRDPPVGVTHRIHDYEYVTMDT